MRVRLVVILSLVVFAATGAVAAAPATQSGSRAVAAARLAEPPTKGVLLSGTVSQLEGVHVWTDYAYDDRGTNAASAPTYPAGAAPGNAADLIQLQLKLAPDQLGITAILETLTDPKVPSLGVGLDIDANPATGASSVPGGGWTVKGALGLERFVVVEAGSARVLGWNGSAWGEVAPPVSATIDPKTNTMVASVPSAALGSSGPSWRVVGLAGLALPGERWSDGSGPIYDLAYVADTSTGSFQSARQAGILAGNEDAQGAAALVDLAAVGGGKTVLPEPVPGVKNTFLYRSGLELGEGIVSGDGNRRYAGPYQPYVVWFPGEWSQEKLHAKQPLIVFLHGAGGTHLGGSYGSDSGFAGAGPVEVGPGVLDPDAVMVTPLGRGEGNPDLHVYDGPAEQDVLDVIADVIARFGIDQERVVLTGYSLGGVGSFQLSQLYPDRWAGVVEIVGAPDLGPITLADEVQGIQRMPNQLENLRNIRLRMAHSRLDELELIVGNAPDLAALRMQELGYDFRYWQFYRRDHVTFPVAVVQCEMEAAIARGRVRDPARVTYSQEPAIKTKDARTGLNLLHNRAYWMSDMVVRGESFKPGDKGTVDITNLARADRVPTVIDILDLGENITTGRDVCGPNPAMTTSDAWTTIGKAWTAGPPQPTSNGLEVVLTRTASVTTNLDGMSGIDLGEVLELRVTSDGESVLRLTASWPRPVQVEGTAAGSAAPCSAGRLLDIPVGAGTTTLRIVPALAACAGAASAGGGTPPKLAPGGVLPATGGGDHLAALALLLAGIGLLTLVRRAVFTS